MLQIRARCLLPSMLPRVFVLQMIKTPELEQALLVLPFSEVETLAKFFVRQLEAGLEVELCARCAVFLLRVHQVCSSGSCFVLWLKKSRPLTRPPSSR